MTALVDELLNLLREHSSIQRIRVINYDETPTGKLELKIRCYLSNLSGEPLKDLKDVLTEIEKWLSRSPANTPTR